MSFSVLTSDIKVIIARYMDSPKQLAQLFLSHKQDFMKHEIELLYESTLKDIENVFKQFQEDSFVNFQNEINDNIELREKHFSMFVDGYRDNDIISCETDFAIYNSEVSNLARRCRYNPLEFINLLRLSNKVQFDRARHLREDAMQKLFEYNNSNQYDDCLILTFQSGVQIMMKCLNIRSEIIYIEMCLKLVDHKNNKSVVTKAYEFNLSSACCMQRFYWVDIIKDEIRKYVPATFIFGNVENIEYKSDYAEIWRCAYFDVEYLPKYYNMCHHVEHKK